MPVGGKVQVADVALHPRTGSASFAEGCPQRLVVVAGHHAGLMGGAVRPVITRTVEHPIGSGAGRVGCVAATFLRLSIAVRWLLGLHLVLSCWRSGVAPRHGSGGR